MRSIVLANQKGGVGKTTTAIHLAHGFALAGHRTALFDLDPQGNATVAVQSIAADAVVDEALEGLTHITTNLWLLPSPGDGSTLARGATIDVERLKDLVARVADRLDWLVIDCPPRLDDWGWAGVQIAERVVVPVQAEFFAMHGLSQMLASLSAAAVEFPGKAALRGVLPTMVDLREPVTMEILDDLRKNLGDQLLRSVILRDSCLVEAASFGQSVFHHSPHSKGALCYAELVKELEHG
ncbi:MAG: ParA family protein [Planctomycetes bacterium]|nr:ParA family protein [Planctomycetota bacterium]